jgi:hypothetical protein
MTRTEESKEKQSLTIQKTKAAKGHLRENPNLSVAALDGRLRKAFGSSLPRPKLQMIAGAIADDMVSEERGRTERTSPLEENKEAGLKITASWGGPATNYDQWLSKVAKAAKRYNVQEITFRHEGQQTRVSVERIKVEREERTLNGTDTGTEAAT